jgi:competence protein ComEA
MERIPADWRTVDDTEGEPIQERQQGVAGTRPVLAALLLASVVGFSAVAAMGWHLANTASEREVVMEPTAAASESLVPATPTAILVDVSGGVVRPGLYRLPENGRVGDAIAAAGGFGPTVDAAAASSALNLAQKVADGTKIHVPERGAPPVGAGNPDKAANATATAASRSGPLDLNSASQSELEALPGIGPVTAAKIIAARQEAPFRTIEELRERKVVGPATLEKIRALVAVGG